jgi:hypothetical protein
MGSGGTSVFVASFPEKCDAKKQIVLRRIKSFIDRLGKYRYISLVNAYASRSVKRFTLWT